MHGIICCYFVHQDCQLAHMHDARLQLSLLASSCIATFLVTSLNALYWSNEMPGSDVSMT